MFDDYSMAEFVFWHRFRPISAVRHQTFSIAGRRTSLAKPTVQPDGLYTSYGLCRPDGWYLSALLGCQWRCFCI